MALSILDGNQSATTLSTILSSGQHITAHTVVSLGTQAITDIVNATSANLTNTQLRASAVTVGGTVTVGNSVTISSLPAISGTVTANINDPTDILFAGQIGDALFGSDQLLTALTNLPISGTVTVGNTVTIAGTVTANPTGTQTIAGTVTVGGFSGNAVTTGYTPFGDAVSSVPVIVMANSFGRIGTVDVSSGFISVTTGTNRIGVVTIGAGTVTLGASTSQIGSVTASISNTVTIAGTVTANPTGTQTIAGSVTLGASTAQIGSVTASVSKLNDLTSDGGGAQPSFGIQLGFSTEISPGDDYVLVAPSNPLPISGTVTVGNSVTIASLPAISGTVTASLSISSSAITSGSFTSLTSATIVPGNTARKMATIYNLGAGQLFINAGATATTLGGGFMVSLYSGDFYECDYTTTTLSAIFATAGTASWISH